jgi:hypothetical protein
MAPSQPDPPFFLAFKNGSLGANHTHLDLNHINVGVGNTMLLVELGSRPYPADYFSAKRYSYYELGTPGHNTVLIGGKGQVRGKVGKLLGPFEGPNTTTLVGVADGAYEVETTRVRRHVAFVGNTTWIILDEIVTPQPQTVELRFHTYGSIEPAWDRRVSRDGLSGSTGRRSKNDWVVMEGDQALDIRTPDGLTATAETPDGWIRPVRVLRAEGSEPAGERALITVLRPRVTPAAPADVRVDQAPDRITVTVGSTRVQWRRTPDGWQLASGAAAGRRD